MAATSICICGESGSGKSTSLRNLDPKETFIIATIAKPLPFRGWKKNYTKLVIDKDENGNTKSIAGNYYVSDKWDKIIKIMKLVSAKMPYIKNLIVDDLQYTMAFEFVDRASEKSYDKFNEMAQHLLSIFRTTFELRNDLTVVFLTHSENVGTEIDPKYTIKTLGKLLKEKVTTEGLFTCLLFTEVEMEDDGAHYQFITNADGRCIAKSPLGMFDSLKIDNDLKEIIPVVKAYEEEEE